MHLDLYPFVILLKDQLVLDPNLVFLENIKTILPWFVYYIPIRNGKFVSRVKYF